jgi:hypothetical protein
MERHLSLGVATIVALMQVHRTGCREDARQDDDDRNDMAASGQAEPGDENPPDPPTRH